MVATRRIPSAPARFFLPPAAASATGSQALHNAQARSVKILTCNGSRLYGRLVSIVRTTAIRVSRKLRLLEGVKMGGGRSEVVVEAWWAASGVSVSVGSERRLRERWGFCHAHSNYVVASGSEPKR